jgi:UDP-N-acetylmuramyl pentapeptide phosphotransferase/UDP-N-acetylglucosamine-1-phosphate transferase
MTLLGALMAPLIFPGIPMKTALGFVIGGSLVAGVSWLDDLKSLPNYLRFGVHSLVAMMVTFTMGPIRFARFPLLSAVELPWLGQVASLLWVVGLINAYNFMDGIDGIAALQAIVAGLGWTVIGWLYNLELVAWLAVFLLGSSIGFLWHNWAPASIFMGDVGSAFLGYSFATLVLVADGTDPGLIMAGVFIVWPFLFDTILTFLRRALHGENVLLAHRSHLYQRLVIVGYSHKWVTLLYAALALCGVVAALLWVRNAIPDAFVVGSVASLALGLWGFVNLQELHRTQD